MNDYRLKRMIWLPALVVGLVWAIGSRGAGAAPDGSTLGPTTTLVSVDSSGAQGNDDSEMAAISADGHYVAFSSNSTNLVPGDTNGVEDIFVHDWQTGQTTRVSVDSGGAQANHRSWHPAISADGRYVVFTSEASNLVAGDTNSVADVFVHDRQTGQTTRVSVDSNGAQGNWGSYAGPISADGRYVAFESDADGLVPGDRNGSRDVFVHDRGTGQTTRISVDSGGTPGNGRSWRPAISADGRFVAFYSDADNLVAGDTNDTDDAFVHDRQTGQTTRVSVDSGGAQANNISWYPAISADGRFVAFMSQATNLVSGDTNGRMDVFVHDRQTGQTTRISIASGGAQGNGDSALPAISADGRFVAFYSYANNLVPGDTNGRSDVFVHDRGTGQTTRVSVASGGAQANNSSEYPAISADGRYVAFESGATNLVPGDTNGKRDIFVRDRVGEVECFPLTLSHTGNGADPTPSPTYSTGCSAGQYIAGESIALTAAPSPGWMVKGWTGTMNDASTAMTNTVAMPAAAHAASVNYKADTSLLYFPGVFGP